MRVFFCP
jgi:hypothetical protein